MPPILTPRFSLIIPVYCNEGSIADLVTAVEALNLMMKGKLEVIFVVDGSPDASYANLIERLPSAAISSKVVMLSRNFGSFAAIREGLMHARGDFAAVMAADLQEPPLLIAQFFGVLEKGLTDVVFGVREGRNDPWTSKFAAGIFWWIYRRFIQREVPSGGVDVFAVNRKFLERLVSFGEANGSLLGLLFWMGGRREFVSYTRLERQHGKSAWTFGKKFNYLLDSIFAFTDAPVRILLASGIIGLIVSTMLGLVIFVAKITSLVAVPGYAGTMLAILFFGGLNALGLGLVGNYAWRGYENTKQRPSSITMLVEDFSGTVSTHDNATTDK